MLEAYGFRVLGPDTWKSSVWKQAVASEERAASLGLAERNYKKKDGGFFGNMVSSID